MAVADGRITAVGSRADIEPLIGPDTDVIDIGDGCALPGLIEAHGHPLMEAIALSDRLVDIRPVTIADADSVVAAVKAEVTKRGDDGAYLNGWDPLLQNGLPEPTLDWLNGVAPDTPLVIIHNSGHKAYFNSASAARSGLTRDTPDPKGAQYGHDASGELDGTAEETGAVFPLLAGAIQPSDYPAMLLAECARLNRAGLTTCSEMAFDPMFRPMLDQLRDKLTVRLRTYEMSTAEMTTDESVKNGDDTVRQVGIKIWVDGSPWVGNIDLSFPYLDTAATRAIGVVPGSCGHANYTREQLTEIARSRSRRHLQHLRRPDPLLGRHHRRRAVRRRTRITLDAMRFGGRHRYAHLVAQRPAGDARRAAAQHQRRGHQDRAQWSGTRTRAVAHRRAGHQGPDDRRGMAAFQ
jgi:predicted amidohydrolase YtcJ